MSSTVFPEQNEEFGFDEYQDQGLPQQDSAYTDTLNAARKNLRTTVGKVKDNSELRERLINNVATSKYGGLKQDIALRQATADYQSMVATAAARIRTQNKQLPDDAINSLAEEEVLSSPNSFKSVLSATAGVAMDRLKQQAKEKLKEEAKKKIAETALKYAAPEVALLSKLFTTKEGRIILIAIVLCFCGLIVGVFFLVTYATQNKWDQIKSAPGLIYCAGGTDTEKLAECLVQQKAEEYNLTDPTPE